MAVFLKYISIQDFCTCCEARTQSETSLEGIFLKRIRNQNNFRIPYAVRTTLTLTLAIIPNPNPNLNPNPNPKTVGCVGYSKVMPKKGYKICYVQMS